LKRRSVVSLVPLALPLVLVAGSVAAAPVAGAATGPAGARIDRARVLLAMDNPLAAQVRARLHNHQVVGPTADAASLVALHQTKAFLAALKTPTLVFTRLNSTTDAFGLQTKNLLTGAVGNLLALSASSCPISPRLSPDTTRVVFVDYGTRCLGDGQLDLLTIASSSITTLVAATGTTYLSLPNWSPDGSTVLYTLEQDDALQNFVSSSLLTVPAIGGPPTGVGGGGVGGYDGVYSPDGTKIVFAPTLNPKNNFLSVMNADGSAVTPLTHTALSPDFSPIHPSWSPDGTKVSFTYVKTFGTYKGVPFFINGIGVAAVDDSSGGGLAVTSASRYNAFYSSWSADSTEIYFDVQLRDATTGKSLTNAGVYATGATGVRRATLVADTLNAYEGVSFAGDPLSTGSASTYTPLSTPVRVLPKMLLGPSAVTDVQVTGVAGVPAGATAATLNLTGVSPTSNTYLQAYPTPVTGTAVPLVSNLNLVPGQIAAVAVQVALSPSGSVRIRNAGGTTGVIVDVSGYFTAGTSADQYVPITPVRAVDTTLGTGGTTDITVTGHDPANAGLTPAAVVLNLTGASPTHGTYLQVYPTQTSGPPPTISNLNLAAHAIRANLVTVGLGIGNTVTIRNAFGTIRAIADVVGYYYTAGATGGLSYYPLQPARFMDTRDGTDTLLGSAAPLGPGSITAIGMRGTATTRAGMITVPATAQAYVYNLTAVAPTGYTYLTAYPFGPTRPLSSNVNAFPGTVVPNLAITGADASGQIDLFNLTGNTPVLVDLAGYYAP
jgi:hypothetical protein